MDTDPHAGKSNWEIAVDRNDSATTPATNPPPAVGSSDWVGEWEAALDQTLEAVAKTPVRAMRNETWEKARAAMKALDEIVYALRRRSPSSELTGQGDE